MTMTLAQEGDYCRSNDFDPEDPRCAHVILTGRVIRLEEGSEEEDFARAALYARHPIMKTWPKGEEDLLGIRRLDVLFKMGTVDS